MPTFGEKLKELRTDKSITQKEMADYLKITVTAYQNYEYDRREMNIKSLTKLADFFNASADYLTGRSDDPIKH